MHNNIPLVERPDFWEAIKLSGYNDIELRKLIHYKEFGYLIVDDLKLRTGIEQEIIGDLDDLYEPLTGNFSIVAKNPRIVNAWKKSEAVKELALNDEIIRTLCLLYQRRPIPFQTINFNRGSEQKTHSDMIHFNSIPQRFMCGVWVALEDITLNNGPLHYYPESHTLPFYDMIDIGVKGSDNRDFKKEMMAYTKKYETFIQMIIDSLQLKKETLHIKKGQAIIWSANLLHGGDPIIDKTSTRHSQVTHYFFEDCTYYTPYYSDMAINKIYLLDIVNISTGKKEQNRYFGKTVKKQFQQSLKLQITEMLSKISHLFPKATVSRMKDILGR